MRLVQKQDAIQTGTHLCPTRPELTWNSHLKKKKKKKKLYLTSIRVTLNPSKTTLTSLA